MPRCSSRRGGAGWGGVAARAAEDRSVLVRNGTSTARRRIPTPVLDQPLRPLATATSLLSGLLRHFSAAAQMMWQIREQIIPDGAHRATRSRALAIRREEHKAVSALL